MSENALTLTNDEMKFKFRTLFLQGEEVKKINETLGINQNTFDVYVYQNKYGLRDWYNELKKERILRKIEAESEKILSFDDENDKKVAIKQKEMEFIRETLLKDLGYSKRIEQTGANGEHLAVNVMQYSQPKPIEAIKVAEFIETETKPIQ